MAYVISLKNRLNKAPRYLMEVKPYGYPMRTTDIDAAATFKTKAAAQTAIAAINRNDLYHTEVEIVRR